MVVLPLQSTDNHTIKKEKSITVPILVMDFFYRIYIQDI